jgi:hypothetical protein
VVDFGKSWGKFGNFEFSVRILLLMDAVSVGSGWVPLPGCGEPGCRNPARTRFAPGSPNHWAARLPYPCSTIYFGCAWSLEKRFRGRKKVNFAHFDLFLPKNRV